MKTVVTEEITTLTSQIGFGYWDGDEFIPLVLDEEDHGAEFLRCSPELVAALITSFGTIANLVNDDLEDIWRRLDDIEARF